MKLITRTSYYYLLISLLVSLICGISFYYYVSKLWNEEINEQMEIDKNNVLEFVKKFNKLPEYSPLDQNVIRYSTAHVHLQTAIKDTLLMSPLKDEFLPYRELCFPVTANDTTYRVALYKPLMEKDDLLQTIAKSLFLFLIALALLLAAFHQWISRKLWKPFYQTLDQLHQTNMQRQKTTAWPPTTIAEFRDLQSEFDRMLSTIRHQFQNLNEFTGYASHEIQTALAIIRSKLELIMQNQNLSENDYVWLQDAFSATDRLSRLTNSLLVLSKVDNHQYPVREKIDLGVLIQSKMESLKEWQAHSDLEIEVAIGSYNEIQMDPVLADILIHNVVTNAYKHNVSKGRIRIELAADTLRIANTGLALKAEAALLFKPFVKESDALGSTGLGLAIVDRICQYYGYRVDYQYASGWHTLTINFTADRISPDLERNVV